MGSHSHDGAHRWVGFIRAAGTLRRIEWASQGVVHRLVAEGRVRVGGNGGGGGLACQGFKSMKADFIN